METKLVHEPLEDHKLDLLFSSVSGTAGK